MQQRVQDMPAPPEAGLIKLARQAARLGVDDAVAKVKAAGGSISPTYWRDIERGHGGRRGRRVPARASDGLLAQMAAAVGVTPAQLRDAARDHPDGDVRAAVIVKAARVLEEILRREGRAGAAPLDSLFPASPEDYYLPETEAFTRIREPYQAAIEARVVVARGAYPDAERLPGGVVFPDDWQDAATWDGLMGSGIPEAAAVRTVAQIRAARADRAGQGRNSGTAG